ncbi:AAA family ATPase [Paenibacillus sp. HB172176]|uniref:AAA family ATPase n=1 Tax=Paenibacillus sp. HB172176 TaxID=2493690 RepID=UPI00143AFCF6|nr:AAA family ATPase [Paenibacillus sp. HB172176]
MTWTSDGGQMDLDTINETPLKTIMSTSPLSLHTFFSIVLPFIEEIGRLHERGLLRMNVSPRYMKVVVDSGKIALLPIDHPIGQDSGSLDASPQEELRDRLAYLSPEQTGRMKRKTDERSDLYGAGVLLYELLTGKLPFPASTAEDWIYAHMALLPTPPEKLSPGTPSAISDIIMKLLAKAPEERYQSAEGLIDDMTRCRDEWEQFGYVSSFELGETDAVSGFRLPEKLYGREREVEKLTVAYECACSGESSLVMLSGYAGSGKTALIRALQASIAPHRGYFAAAKFEQLKQSTPYAAIHAVMRQLTRRLLTEEESALCQWRDKLQGALGQSGSLLTEVIPELSLIIGPQPALPELPPAEATKRFQLLFGSFMKVFACAQHPLTVWFDDLHWADEASLGLLRAFVKDAGHLHLLMLGTYRNREEGEDFPKLLEEAIPEEVVVVHRLALDGLDYRNVRAFIADLLHADPISVKPLAEAMYRKTGGNPLYLKQMLQLLYEERLLYFCKQERRWAWDMEAINKRKAFENVTDLIVRRMSALPAGTAEVLRMASCIGLSFDLRMLSIIAAQEDEVTERQLQPALNEGLLATEKNRFIFLHDQVQRAAHHLLTDAERIQIHLRIGRILLQDSRSTDGQTDDRLFETVHHLNLGRSAITDLDEIEQLAALNLKAGRKAKTSADYALALTLLKTGVKLLEEWSASVHETLSAELMLERSECEYFCGNADMAESILEQMLLQATAPAERARIFIIQITMYAYLKQEWRAFHIAIEAMAEFGLRISDKSSTMSIMTEISLTQLTLARHQRALQGMSLNHDPMHKALADIVMASSSIIFIIDEELSVILFAKYVRMSLNQGHSDAFCIALGSYAIALCAMLKSNKLALRLVDIALHYAERSHSVLLKGKMQFMKGFILQLNRPQDSERYFLLASKLSMEGGDMVYACYSISSHVITASDDLRALREICRSNLDYAGRGLDEMTLRVLHLTEEYVRLLQHKPAPELVFDSEYFDADMLAQGLKADNTQKHNILYYYTCRVEVYYLFGYYSRAAELAAQAMNYEKGTMLSFNQRLHFYYALSTLADYETASTALRARYRSLWKKLFSRMKRWSRVMSESTEAKYRLMLAEITRLNGNHAKAVKDYDAAVSYARQIDNSRDEAIACERAGRCFMEMRRVKEAKDYLFDACRAYYRWGAAGKVQSLKEDFPFLDALVLKRENENSATKRLAAGSPRSPGFESEPQPILPSGMNPDPSLAKEMDMSTIRQVSKIDITTSEEIDLLNSFIDLAIRNAGAERAVMLIQGEDGLRIEAEKNMNPLRVEAVEMQSEMVAAFSSMPYSGAVVRFALRTREAVVLSNAVQSPFAWGAYIQAVRPKSILCLPIVYTDHRIGVLYLENNLLAGAFTAERIEVLELVLSRMVHLKLLRKRDEPVETGSLLEDSSSSDSGWTMQQPLIEPLSARELDILRLMADGLSNKEIALRLDIKEGTVKSHGVNIYGKLQAKRRAQAVARARELGLLE